MEVEISGRNREKKNQQPLKKKMFSTYCFLLNIATTFEKVRGTANIRPTARYTLPTDLPSYAKIVICGKKFVLVVI